MEKIFKKNQLTILVISLMLITAGYLNYNKNIQTSTDIASIGDATLVSSNIQNSIINTTKNETKLTENNNKINNECNYIISEKKDESIKINTDISKREEYFTSSRIERDTMYSQMLESYQKIIDSNKTTEKQKSSAQDEIEKINKVKNAIMISENLIKLKGFDNVIIFVNDDSISIVIGKDELKKEEIAQIQSIIAREMNAKINNIHIINK